MPYFLVVGGMLSSEEELTTIKPWQWICHVVHEEERPSMVLLGVCDGSVVANCSHCCGGIGAFRGISGIGAEVIPSKDPLDASVGAKLGLILVSNVLSVGVIFSN